MKINKDFKKNYPKLTSWIQNHLPKIKDNKKVWDAFVKYSELSPAKAELALKIGNPPELHSEVMPNANGQFIGAKYPGRIYLAKAICEKFEKSDDKKPEMHVLVESTILHEMVHWGDWKDGKDQAGEEGKKFEKSAYGKDINRYW